MKKKLDLNNLLAKYEGMSAETHHVPVYSPAKEYDYAEAPIEQQFYQSRTYHAHNEISKVHEPITGNFQMSKSQCQNFLSRVREELRHEERGMVNFSENSWKHIHQRFQANHQKIRREILDLLDQAFRNNERYITEQLKRQGSIEPAEFSEVHRRIAIIDQDINRLLYGLKGSQYRKSIAETVVKDFTVELASLRETLKRAKQNYLSSLGEVEPDRTRIDCIKEDLHRLFRLSKRNQAVLNKGLFNILGQKFKASDQVRNDNPKSQTSYIPPSDRQGNERQRKSFFNFGFNQ